MISYTGLIEILKEKGHTKTDLTKELGISSISLYGIIQSIRRA